MALERDREGVVDNENYSYPCIAGLEGGRGVEKGQPLLEHDV